MNIQILKKQFEETLGKRAEKLKVRECDEMEPGQFVAYVDQGNESFDVMLTFSMDGQLIADRCECGTKNRFCEHRYALLLFIEKGKKIGDNTKKARRKLSKVEKLMLDVDDLRLRQWVKEQLESDKELLFRFESTIGSTNKIYTIADVDQITNEAIKSVAGRKTILDLTQYTKILQLFKTVHRPIFDQYLNNLKDIDDFKVFAHLIDLCLNFHDASRVNSTKLKNQLVKVFDEVALAANHLETETSWQEAWKHYFNHLKPSKNHLQLWVIQFLNHYFQSLSLTRKKWFTKQMHPMVELTNAGHLQNESEIQLIFWNWVEVTDEFIVYGNCFLPTPYDDQFNLKLFEKKMESGQIKEVEKLLASFIQSNYVLERTTGYLDLQRKIYEQRGEYKKVAQIVLKTLPINLSFPDFLWIKSYLDEESYKKLRTSLLSKARSFGYRENAHKFEFIFRLMEHEKKYKKMIESVEWGTPPHLIEAHFEKMLASGPLDLMNALEKACYNSYYFWEEEIKKQAKEKAEIFMVKVKSHISKTTAQLYLTTKSYTQLNGKNPFYVAVTSWLKEN